MATNREPGSEPDRYLWQWMTEKSLNAMRRAQEEADRRGENLVKGEHVLLGILQEGDSRVESLLEKLNLSPDELTRQIEALLIPGPGRDGTILRLDSRVRLALRQAHEEAIRLHYTYIGPEHLLLGLISAQSGATGAVFLHHGPQLQAAREALDAVIGQHPHLPPAVSAPASESGVIVAGVRPARTRSARSQAMFLLLLIVLIMLLRLWLASH